LTKNSKNNLYKIKFSFEKLYSNYFKQDYKNILTLSNEEIILKLNKILNIFKEKLSLRTEMIINLLYEINGYDIEKFSNEFLIQLFCFEQLSSIYKDKEIENKKNNSQNPKEILIKIYSLYQNLQKPDKIETPFLPILNKTKYKYTLVIDLDETLVHYVEEREKAYVQVRPFADYFLTEMGKYFEIVIFTSAEEDYANLVLKELDKRNIISHKLYRKHTNQSNGVFLKDLSKLGRDIKKICIIDNTKENYGLQPENGLHISSYLGDQCDNELLSLSDDLMKIANSDLDDIRPVVKEINTNMQNRYKENNALLE
jgi:Dullard-like phosphatase family protein